MQNVQLFKITCSLRVKVFGNWYLQSPQTFRLLHSTIRMITIIIRYCIIITDFRLCSLLQIYIRNDTKKMCCFVIFWSSTVWRLVFKVKADFNVIRSKMSHVEPWYVLCTLVNSKYGKNIANNVNTTHYGIEDEC